MIHKYRVWDKIEKEWLEGAEALEVYWLNGELVLFVGIEFADHRNQDEFEILQYTGIEDKNGKDLDWWEGDICHLKGTTVAFVIVKDKGCFWFENPIQGKRFMCWKETETMEKVGNRFENPELLETK